MEGAFALCVLVTCWEMYDMQPSASILPYVWQKFRLDNTYNPRTNYLRRNLFKDKDPMLTFHPICAQYVVIYTRTCRKRNTMFPGKIICVECHPFSQKQTMTPNCNGMGQYTEKSSWDILNSGCSGWWIKIVPDRPCGCQLAPVDSAFIFI